MEKLLKLLYYNVIGIKFAPHLLFFFFSKKKETIELDVVQMNKDAGLNYGITLSLIIHLYSNKFYRNIFMKRISKYARFILWYTPIDKTFYPACNNIGGGILLKHPFSTILNAKSIGDNFMCRQCTTIGNKKKGEKDLPKIGNNVSLGANVCIIGDITIGNNVIVGAGSVVVKSVPDNTVVAGNPATIIKSL